jgi:hypothetical protein
VILLYHINGVFSICHYSRKKKNIFVQEVELCRYIEFASLQVGKVCDIIKMLGVFFFADASFLLQGVF